MKKKNWSTRLACLGLVAAVIAGGAIAAGTQGSQENPLVTLSYLNEVAVPEIMKQVEKRVEEALDKAREELGESATFQAVELKAGESLYPTAGSQLLPRSGALECTDALVDLSTGTTWPCVGSLVADHLYIATGSAQSVTATEDALVLVQGRWEIK